MDRVSDYAISFHYIDQWDVTMIAMEYIVYHLKIYGIVNTPEMLPKRLKAGEILPPPKRVHQTTTPPTRNVVNTTLEF